MNKLYLGLIRTSLKAIEKVNKMYVEIHKHLLFLSLQQKWPINIRCVSLYWQHKTYASQINLM